MRALEASDLRASQFNPAHPDFDIAAGQPHALQRGDGEMCPLAPERAVTVDVMWPLAPSDSCIKGLTVVA